MTKRTAAPAITDPAKTLERCYERLAQAEDFRTEALGRGWTATALHQSRKIAGIKATITRCHRMLGV